VESGGTGGVSPASAFAATRSAGARYRRAPTVPMWPGPAVLALFFSRIKPPGSFAALSSAMAADVGGETRVVRFRAPRRFSAARLMKARALHVWTFRWLSCMEFARWEQTMFASRNRKHVGLRTLEPRPLAELFRRNGPGTVR